MLDFILEIAEVFLSWRLYLGFAVTALLCWLILSVVPNQALQIFLCAPIILTGIVLSFMWQIRADRS